MKNKRLLLINILIAIAFIAVVYVGLSSQETVNIKESKPKKQEQTKELILDEQTLAPSHGYEYKKTEGSPVPSFTLELDPNAFTDLDATADEVQEDVEEVSLSDEEITTEEEETEQYIQQLQEPTRAQEVEQGGSNNTSGSTSTSITRPKANPPTNTPKKDEQPKEEPVKKNNFELNRSKPLEEKKEDIKQKEESSNIQQDTDKTEESSDKGTSSTNTED